MFGLLCGRPLGILETLELKYLAIKLNPYLHKLHLATCSPVPADVPCVVCDCSLFCEMLCKFAKDGFMGIIHAGSGGSETAKCGGESEFVSALLKYAC